MNNLPLMHPWKETLPLKGDLDGDNKLTYNDAAIALQIAVGSYPFKSTADMNNNGKVTSCDALMILQAVK